MEQQDFIQKWTSRFGSLWDFCEETFPYEPNIPVIAIVMYQDTEKNSVLPVHPEELRRPDTIAFDSITGNYFERHFICHNSSTFEYRTFQGNYYNINFSIELHYCIEYATIFYLEATANCKTMNSTIKTDLTFIEVEQLFKIEYERLLTQQNQNCRFDYTHVFTRTGSVKISVSSIRNEFGEIFTLKDFGRNRSISRNFDQIYSEVSHFPQASSFQNQFLIHIRKSNPLDGI